MRSLVSTFNALGKWGAAALAEGAAKAAFRLRVRLRVVRENLTAAFGGEMTPERLEVLARKCYHQWALSFVEWARTWGRGLDDVLDRVEIEGDEPILHAVAQGRGVILVTAHFGNFEVMPLCWARRHGPINVVVRPLDNPLLDKSLNRLRSRYECRVLTRRGIVRKAIRCLRSGKLLGVLVDQNMVHDEGVFVDFFGKPASTTSLPALLALRTGAAVFPGFILRQAPFRHRMVFGPEIPTIETGDLRADVEANTAQYTQAVEDAIRSHPDHWLWMHRRWRTRPIEETARVGALGGSGAKLP
ncbi:MAG: lysophospholipid acyltransferase family protein [Nitrospinota bacterium]